MSDKDIFVDCEIDGERKEIPLDEFREKTAKSFKLTDAQKRAVELLKLIGGSEGIRRANCPKDGWRVVTPICYATSGYISRRTMKRLVRLGFVEVDRIGDLDHARLVKEA